MKEKLFTGNVLSRLDNIKQWSEKDTHLEESVSQHSYKVAVFATTLFNKIYGRDHWDSRLESLGYRITQYALFHDWDEAIILRDLSHELKYNDYNGEEIRNVINDYVKHESKNLPLFLKKMIVGDIPPFVKKFVKICDWMALLHFLKREKNLGNSCLEKERKYCLEQLDSSLDFLFEIDFEENRPVSLNKWEIMDQISLLI